MKAPQFRLKDLRSNQEVSLKSYEGKPVLLTFWASWCPDCKRDLFIKNQFFRSIHSDRLVFLTINVIGREGKEDDGKKFLEEQGYTFTGLMDVGTKTYDDYQCFGVPTTFLLNENHEIVATFHDKAKWTDILAELGKVL